MARKGKSGGPAAPVEQKILDQAITDILSERYLSYALSTIMSRSLPDVRDGLKPVHRRLMYAMYQLKLKPELSPKKSARVVGDVIGKFHPHGDQSVYDALVRLAQDFAVRYPLVDGQGNFGNIDGDNAAAMRYTEARLTKVAELLMEGIDENAVDFRPTYDGEGSEPIVMPANFPNLLANGSSGIAVGMATNIPPHNVGELCEAMELMLEEDASVEQLCKIVKGPDFPTGGTLVEPKENILDAYKTGKGSFRLRAKWEVEEAKGGAWQIVVTEIPYQVQKSRLIEKIAELITSKKLMMLDDVRDESAEDIRLVLVPKSRNIAPELLMEALYRNCDLEIRFAMNMNVLDGGLVPKVMNLKEVLQAWLNHRQEVLVRRSQYRLEEVLHRLEVLAGYLIVYLNIDEVIRIIRESDEPKPVLMKTFKLTDVQAEAILNMRLRSLRKLEEMELKREHDNLSKERDSLQALLKSESKQWKEIKKQIGTIKELFGAGTALGARRTKIGKAPSLVAIEQIEDALTEKEPITVICSAKGWIKAMKGHEHNPKDFTYKDGDRARFVIEAMTNDKLIAFGTNGRFYTIACDKLPPGRGFGEPVRLMVDLPNDSDIAALLVYNPEAKLLVASEDGRGFIVPEKDVLAQTKNGKQILNVDEKTEAKICLRVAPDHNYIATIGTNRKMLIFPLEQIPEMTKGKGVILQKFKDGRLGDARTFNLKAGLTYRSGSSEAKVDSVKAWIAERAQAGKLPPNGFPKSGKFD
ncbi:MAG: DNA topoisomerase IV subunit A [Alphaproteobacteria bacterium]|nr:DNA topoisomerase IV subunit A [Alphaproteobacteria bacterium]